MYGRTKHMDIKYHFFRDLVTEGSIKLEFCSTRHHLADICTKALSNQKFLQLRSVLGKKGRSSRKDVGSKLRYCNLMVEDKTSGEDG